MNPSRQARFEALFNEHYVAVHRYALRRAEPPLAEEVVNEAFLVAWRRFDQVPEEPLPWLYATAGHVLANRRREAARHARRVGAAATEAGRTPARGEGGASTDDLAGGRRRAARAPDTGRDPAERLAERDAALRAFAALNEPDREALRLVAWERLSLADAARVAGVSRPAFAMRVHRARRRLAARLREQDAALDLDFPMEPADA
ncbi:sigma-70 family RNA polymerase sigma factor [Solirubrobacter sp. CPCC 204708]|uniref:Sigma-70 family RNA polymerase sigma factor n=1 Tax=Solirubrobacter deserti TaxID=2282478 RepID=A0ABT4RRM7_9ACTN|nr:sigma-70 family RNA polymerase sigma factor [Solirubrobacter deserti]MBE2314842.1 sigma-70 family RNA polymerase sigma factor [Solirubrobacter deserti]MDA0141251.1 sigma-70 family RNA polymerase sigma factor [Solirubrobacter deserti]